MSPGRRGPPPRPALIGSGHCASVRALMNKDQLQFLVSGILFGFLVGYIIAYAVHEPQVVQHAAPVPAAGNMGMGQSVPPAAGGAAAGEPGGGGRGGGDDQMRGRGFGGSPAP